MAKKMLIDATHAEETRVVVVDGNRIEEFDFDSSTRTQITGNIYLAKVTRVEPSLQAAFVDYGGNRHGFLAFSEIHPDYYQIPQADREALLAEQASIVSKDDDLDDSDEDDNVEPSEDEKTSKKSRSRRGKSSKTSKTKTSETTEDENNLQAADLDANNVAAPSDMVDEVANNAVTTKNEEDVNLAASEMAQTGDVEAEKKPTSSRSRTTRKTSTSSKSSTKKSATISSSTIGTSKTKSSGEDIANSENVDVSTIETAPSTETEGEKPKSKTTTRRKSTKSSTKKTDGAETTLENEVTSENNEPKSATVEALPVKKTTRSGKAKSSKSKTAASSNSDETAEILASENPSAETEAKPKTTRSRKKKSDDDQDDSGETKTIAAASDGDDVIKSDILEDLPNDAPNETSLEVDAKPDVSEAEPKQEAENNSADAPMSVENEDSSSQHVGAEPILEEAAAEEKPKPKSRTRKSSTKSKTSTSPKDEVETVEAQQDDDAQTADEQTPDAETSDVTPKKRTRKPRTSRTSKSAASKAENAIAQSGEAESQTEVTSKSSTIDELFSDPRDEDDNDESDNLGFDADEDDKKTSSRSSSRRRTRKSSKKQSSETNDNDDNTDADVEVIETTEDVVEETQQKRRHAPLRRYKIQEVIKVRQIMLVQVLKEERGNKGAAVTTYLSLPGRYCVLMPNTARGGGISRKIANPSDRKRLKSIANELNVPKGAGLIVRTAGARQDKSEIERDYDFLLRQWNQIRELTLSSVAPAPIYAESGPIKRAIRDLITKDINEILVEGDAAYDEARSYMQILMPERVKDVKAYKDTMPLFSRYQVESSLSGMFNPVVQLKSGGYIVFGVTEALVSVDVNSGRSTKEASIEHTALKTNLEAAEEIARQLKLRDLAGLVVIDFIDMEQRRHNIDVENRLKDSLRSDRARIQVGRISSFGLLEMSRQRLRSGLVEMITQPCPHCHGTGITRADDNMALAVMRAIEEEIYRGKCAEINVRVPVGVANYMFNDKRDHLTNLEARSGIVIKIEGDNTLLNPQFEIEKRKDASRPAIRAAEPITVEQLIESESPAPNEEKEGETKKKRSRGGRRRSRKSQDKNATDVNSEVTTSSDEQGNETAVVDLQKDKKDATQNEDNPSPDTVSDVQEGEKSTDTVDAPNGTETESNADDIAHDNAPTSIDDPVDVKIDTDSVEEKTSSDEPQTETNTDVDASGPAVVSEVEPPKVQSFEPEPIVSDEPPKPKRTGWWNK